MKTHRPPFLRTEGKSNHRALAQSPPDAGKTLHQGGLCQLVSVEILNIACGESRNPEVIAIPLVFALHSIRSAVNG